MCQCMADGWDFTSKVLWWVSLNVIARITCKAASLKPFVDRHLEPKEIWRTIKIMLIIYNLGFMKSKNQDRRPHKDKAMTHPLLCELWPVFAFLMHHLPVLCYSKPPWLRPDRERRLSLSWPWYVMGHTWFSWMWTDR